MSRVYLGEVQENPVWRTTTGTRYHVPGVQWWEAKDAFGRFQAIDVGKRVYRVDGVLQMENEAQRAARLAKAEGQP